MINKGVYCDCLGKCDRTLSSSSAIARRSRTYYFSRRMQLDKMKGYKGTSAINLKVFSIMPSCKNFSLVCATAKLFLSVLSVCNKTLMGGHEAKMPFILAFKIAFCEVPGRELHQVNLRADTGGHHHPLANISVNRKKSSIFSNCIPSTNYSHNCN